MKRKITKPKYAEGAVIGGADAVGMASNIAAPLINKYTTKTVKDAYGQQYQKQNVWGGVGEGAAKGAAISAMLGGADFGASAVIGGAIGGITTSMENDEVQKKINEANKKFTQLNIDNARSNQELVESQGFKSQGQQYATMFKKGGNIAKYPNGGKLVNKKKPVSKVVNKPKFPISLDSRLPSDNTSSYTTPVKNSYKYEDKLMEFLDPTGISNYPDLIQAYEEKRWGDLPIEILGSLPLFGKLGKAAKGLKSIRGVPYGKILPQIDNVNELLQYSKGGYIPKYGKGGKKLPNSVKVSNTSFSNKEAKEQSTETKADTNVNSSHFYDYNSAKFVNNRFNIELEKKLNDKRSNDYPYLNLGFGLDSGTKSSTTFNKNGFEEEFTRNPYQTFVTPNLNLGVGYKFQNNPNNPVNFSTNLEGGVSLANEKLLPYFRINPNLNINFRNRKKDYGYAFANLDIKERLGNTADSDDAEFFIDNKLYSKKDAETHADDEGYNEYNTKASYANLGIGYGKNFKNNMFLQGSYNKNLFTNDNSYNIGLGYRFSKGGHIPDAEYEVEGNEIVQGQAKLEGENQIASDMTKAIGPSHENGGVMGKGGDRVFSDRLKPTKDFIETLKTFKVSIPDNATYAQAAEKLGKLKGKYETNIKSPNPITNRTAKTMVDRIDSFIDGVFQDQEISKQDNEMKTKYAKGGKLPKYNKGGQPDNIPDLVQNPNYKEYNPFDVLTFMETPKDRITKTLDSNKPILSLPQRIGTGKYGEFYLPKTGSDYTEGVVQNTHVSNNDITEANAMGTSGTSTDNKKFNINDDYINTGQALNLGTYLNNLNNIDKQQTNINRITAKPNLIKAPQFLNLAKYNISKEANTMNKDITTKSGNIQDTFARRASINASAMDKLNEATQAQANVDLDVNNKNVGIMNDYKNRKAENENADMIDRLQGTNAKNRLKQEANNSFLAGVMGNVASNKSYKVDEAKMILESMKDGDRGVDDRTLETIKTQHPELYNRYFKFMEKPKKKYGGRLKPAYC